MGTWILELAGIESPPERWQYAEAAELNSGFSEMYGADAEQTLRSWVCLLRFWRLVWRSCLTGMRRITGIPACSLEKFSPLEWGTTQNSLNEQFQMIAQQAFANRNRSDQFLLGDGNL